MSNALTKANVKAYDDVIQVRYAANTSDMAFGQAKTTLWDLPPISVQPDSSFILHLYIPARNDGADRYSVYYMDYSIDGTNWVQFGTTAGLCNYCAFGNLIGVEMQAIRFKLFDPTAKTLYLRLSGSNNTGTTRLSGYQNGIGSSGTSVQAYYTHITLTEIGTR